MVLYFENDAFKFIFSRFIERKRQLFYKKIYSYLCGFFFVSLDKTHLF